MPAARSRRKPVETLSGLGAALIDALGLSVYVVDPELRVVAWNKLRERGPYGRPRREVLGRSLTEIPSFRGTIPVLRAVFRTGKPQEETVETGSGRIFHVRRLPVKRGRQVTHVLARFEDITEKRRLEMRLIASDRLAFLGQLLAGVAHEISNPLAGIAGCAEALASLALAGPGEAERGEAREFRELLRSEVARCERLVRTLLESARPHPGAAADLRAVVSTALRLLERHPAFARVRVVSRIPADLRGRIDPDSLRQVVMALATNAARAMAGQGSLTLRAGRENGRIFLDVSDTGPGVPPPIRSRIFEPYFTTDRTKGTGLGLAIARSLVRGRGGDLVCRPRRGAGGSFRVLLKPAEGGA